MKQITKNTILRCGDKTYQPVEVDGVIYWVILLHDTDFKINDYVFEYGKPIVKITKLLEDNIIWESLDKKSSACDSIVDFYKIIAQSSPHLDGIPVISLDSYVEKLANEAINKRGYTTDEYCDGVEDGYNSNPNQYTQKDIEEAARMGRDRIYDHFEILKLINQISEIIVDEQFNIISYE